MPSVGGSVKAVGPAAGGAGAPRARDGPHRFLGGGHERSSRAAAAVRRLADALKESEGPWLLGARISLADVAIMPVIVRMHDLRLAHLWSDRPVVARWLEAIRADPAFRPTYYPGSLLTEKYPHLRAQLGR